MENKIVVHLKSGSILKGVTHDFDPAEDTFHLLPAEGGGVPKRVVVEEMKALFYVKDYVGNRHFVASKQFQEDQRAERRVILVFTDGEEMWGTVGESASAPGAGFFFYPADKADNNIRLFVVRSSLREVREVSD